jgi:hypothetical protein
MYSDMVVLQICSTLNARNLDSTRGRGANKDPIIILQPKDCRLIIKLGCCSSWTDAQALVKQVNEQHSITGLGQPAGGSCVDPPPTHTLTTHCGRTGYTQWP